MPVAQIAGFRIFFKALLAGLIAPRGKIAARAGVDRGRRFALNFDDFPFFQRIQRRAVGNQDLGVRMLRIVQNLVGNARFYDPAQVHDRNPVGNITGCRDIMADENHRRVFFLA